MPKKTRVIETNEPGSVVPDVVKPKKTRKIQKSDIQKKIDRHKSTIVELKELIAENEVILNKMIEETSRELGLTLFRRQLATQEKKLEKLIEENGDLDE